MSHDFGSHCSTITETRRLTRRYLLALGLIASLSMAAFLLLSESISGLDASPTFVNIASRQLMLSQRAAMFSERLATEADPAARDGIAHQLAATADLMRRSHKGLIEGDEGLNLPTRPLSNPLRVILFGAGKPGLDKEVMDYLGWLDELVLHRDVSQAERDRLLTAIRACAADRLPESIGKLVKQYEREAHSDIKSTASLHGFELLVVLATLGLEVLFIFRPMVQQIARERTHLVRSERELRHRAWHDELTGLPNRAMFNQHLQETVETANRRDGNGAVLLVDLDRFKFVNDRLGHAAGDELLRQVAIRLTGVVDPATSLVARLGGDEFAIILMAVADDARVETLCRRIVAELGRPFSLRKGEAQIGASVGGALLPRDASDAQSALRCADLALYESKEGGRGCHHMFAAELNAKFQTRHAVEADLRQALERGEFELHFQPKYRTACGELTGVEALLRWRHPVRGLLLPGAFIEVAEQTGLIVPIGEWVLETACAHAAGWPRLGMAVNLSPAQLRDPGIVAAVHNALTRSGIDPARMELEVTERQLLEDLEGSRAILLELKALGVRLAVDDFGTGYNSFAHLQCLPFDRIKIDRQFVNGIGNSGKAEAIVAAILSMARGLGMTVTAEGIEQQDQLTYLRDAQCSEVQGFLLGRPMIAALIDGMAARPPAPTLPAILPYPRLVTAIS